MQLLLGIAPQPIIRMQINQKRASNKATFEFREDELYHTVRDASGSCAFAVDYEAIPEDFSELEERKSWFRNVGMLWILIGGFQLYAQLVEGGGGGVPFWLILGAGFIAYYFWSTTRYKIFDTAKGRIFVMCNRDEERVINELKKRRAELIVRRYARILDPRAPENEAARFNWLHEQKYISHEAFENLMIELRLAEAGLQGTTKE